MHTVWLVCIFFSVALANWVLNDKDRAYHPSMARIWNERLLSNIRLDQARPTVHARNLFHTSALMWDAWAAYTDTVDNYLHLEKASEWQNLPNNRTQIEAARNATISYGMYTLLKSRFLLSPGKTRATAEMTALMYTLGYDPDFSNSTGEDPRSLGLRIAETYIDYGFADGSNEQNDYNNTIGYKPVNPPLNPTLPGNPNMIDPNRYQPLVLSTFVDQNGVTQNSFPAFVGPHWGNVKPFALTEVDKTVYGNYTVYLDRRAPPNYDKDRDIFIAAHSAVIIKSSYLDMDDGVVWDISPASKGNNTIGTTDGTGYAKNPVTGLPYTPQYVKRGDYCRLLAEFWADGPTSETPPGHWNTIINYVQDHPNFKRSWRGVGPELDPLEYDVKAYLTLNGALHDAAIVAWSHKGYYDSSRPISVIRYMADRGQSSNSSMPSYNDKGIKLEPGIIEVITEETARFPGRHYKIGVGNLGAIAIRGHMAPTNTSEQGTVDWMLAKEWWPYQRKTFVTPPFAGYMSGHSTFSRTAAEILTAITGSPWFPDGLGQFYFEKGSFLQFEYGPSVNMSLEWASYRDAADESGISRIYGGIHPYIDDFPGRLLGPVIAPKSLNLATKYFQKQIRPSPDTSGGTMQMSDSAATIGILGVIGGLGLCFALVIIIYEVRKYLHPTSRH